MDEAAPGRSATDRFPTDPAGLPLSEPPAALDLRDGDELELRIAPVALRLGDETVRMLAYGGSVPGPTLRIAQGSRLTVHVVNEGDLETTVHWHGLRLDNRYDGTHETQEPIPVGGRFTYELTFPDPGAYWYHPHIREDYGQELGLYGTIVVTPSDPDHWPPADRELALTLDDLLVEDGRVAPFSRTETTYAAMGRYGNVLLVNGSVAPELPARAGEVVRLYLTNTANTRTFDVAVPGALTKLVGGDSGHCEHEEIVERVVLAPSERAVVDLLVPPPAGAGSLVLEHRTPTRTHVLATFAVADEPAGPSAAASAFGEWRTNADLAAERARVNAHLDREPDKVVGLVAEMDMGGHAGGHGDHHHDHGGHDHRHHHDDTTDDDGGIEWEDGMVEMNRATTPATMRWRLVDRATGASGADVDWRFRVGDEVKIRLVNELDSDHPMQHPFHVHGAGRFLVLARDGAVERNLAWKDTVLVPAGQTVDILLDVTNPGRWMAHCHIAEHHESGMVLGFTVEP